MVTDHKDELPLVSLVPGGPLFRLCVRLGLCDAELKPMYWRVLAVITITWVPLVVLSVITGRAVDGSTELPFFRDIIAQVRFLIAVPAFLVAETAVHGLIGPLLTNFTTRGIIREADVPRFRAAIDTVHR